jgi:peptide/nickel transport system permease protein
MLEVVRQDYVRTARAKGLSEPVVILKHALRNGLIPVITLLGLYLPFLFSGTIFIETVFSWPGMGKMVFDAILQRDYPVIMGGSLIFAMMVVIGNLVADVLYAVVDPRIRYE